jgi:hypothetical protein
MRGLGSDTIVHQCDQLLATLLWPESEPRRARAVLRRNLSTLRKALANGWLSVSRDTIGVDLEADDWPNVDQFRSLLGTWEAHGHPQDQVCIACKTRNLLKERGKVLELGFSSIDTARLPVTVVPSQ